MVTVTPASRTISNGTPNDAGPVQTNFTELYNNDGTLATAVTNLENGSYNPTSPIQFTPTATVLPFAGVTVPNGYLLCDGSQVSQSTYANLYNALGGSSNPWLTTGQTLSAGNFFLPDFRGRMPLGSGTGTASDATAHTTGSQNGHETHTNIVAEMASHTHSAADSGHVHGYTQTTIPAGSGIQNGNNLTTGAGAYNTGTGYANISVGYAGSSVAYSIMNPFAVVQMIIKT